MADWFRKFRKAKAAPPILHPRRQGVFKDLFSERVVISFPARSGIPRETELLRAEAESFARFSFGDLVMRRGKLIVKTDEELTHGELASANHLILGRTDNHRWLEAAQRRLLARHVRGRLFVRGETYLGKTLIAATCQRSPWNRERVRGIAEQLCAGKPEPLAVNVFDPQQRRFLRQEAFDAANAW